MTASRYEVSDRTQPSATYLSRDDIESLITLGDDTVRVAHQLPGVATNEFSARPYVRGGATNELAVLIDGVRLVEPYHLRDFQGVFSVIDQRVVEQRSGARRRLPGRLRRRVERAHRHRAARADGARA